MRKIKAFSAQMCLSSTINYDGAKRSIFSETHERTNPSGVVSTFTTPSMIKMEIRDMKRPINVRFLQLIKSSQQVAKSTKDPDDIMYLKRYMVNQLTYMLGQYVDMLDSNPSLQLQTYLKITSVIPAALDSAKVLSKVMILANRVKRSSGILPAKNQRDLNRAMENFISDVIDNSTKIDIRNPLINESLQR